MKFQTLIASASAALVAASPLPQDTCETNEISSQDATAFAFAYGYPIYSYGLTCRGFANAQTNRLAHQPNISDANQVSVVRPNVDTLYSQGLLDLSSSDLVIEVPEIKDRFWVWPFYDFYGNNVANIGAVSDSKPGKYLVRLDPDNIGVHKANCSSGYQAYINLPTPYASCFVRILVKTGPNDLQAVKTIQQQLHINATRRAGSPAAPKLNLTMFSDPEWMPGTQTLEKSIMKLTAKLAPYNQPTVPEDRVWVPEVLRKAGMRNSTYVQPRLTNLTLASAAANASVAALLAAPGSVLDLGNGWNVRNSSLLGNYGSFYQARYQAAVDLYVALASDVTLYPSYQAQKKLTIAADEGLLMSFSAEPKVKTTGFWSLTMYDGEGFLIKNDLNRYSLGDRSNLTFSDGTKLRDGGDGPFQILVQPANVAPPANWTDNWLPAPSNGGEFTFTLRFYGHEKVMSNGSYVYPVVETIKALTP